MVRSVTEYMKQRFDRKIRYYHSSMGMQAYCWNDCSIHQLYISVRFEVNPSII